MALAFCLALPCLGSSPPKLALQDDGSLVVFNEAGSVADFVKQGTPRQAVQIGGQSCHASFGFNSAGKKNLLIGVPAQAAEPVIFDLGTNRISIPPKSALRITFGKENQVERMDGNPQGSVTFQSILPESQTFSSSDLPDTPRSSGLSFTETPPTAPSRKEVSAPPTQDSPFSGNQISPAPIQPTGNTSAPGPTVAEESAHWPGQLLAPPLSGGQLEEEKFYVSTDFGARFVSPMNIVNVVGPAGPSNPIIQKKIAFSTGYRQDINVGVWLTDWFGLALETGFALNAIRGNTQGLTVESSTYWSVPLLAQLCFQYPNETGWIPFINFGFGGGWNFFNLGTVSYLGGTQNSVGLGNDMNTAYQLSAGIRYRIYEEFSMSLIYKFYGTSQPTIDTSDSQQITFGSPVTNSVELGLNFAF